MTRFSLSILVFILFFCLNKSTASSITAIQDGNWANTDTWGGMAVPDGNPCYDTIIIPAGITVTITTTQNLTGCPPTQIFVSGEIVFQNGKKLNLSNGSVVWVSSTGYIDVGSGGGSSTYITIDGDQYWNASDGPLTGPAVLCQSCALPIELLNFDATLNEGVVYLTWQTASEEQNDFFWVQRSVDGFTWENILWMDGAGNSSSLLSYSTEDREPALGLSYYRLKQVDLNGAFTFSSTKVISNGQFYSDQQLLVLPSSSETQQNIVIYFAEPIEGEVEVNIVGVSGAVLFSQKIILADEKWVVINMDKPVSSGVYVVKANYLIEKVFFQ